MKEGCQANHRQRRTPIARPKPQRGLQRVVPPPPMAKRGKRSETRTTGDGTPPTPSIFNGYEGVMFRAWREAHHRSGGLPTPCTDFFPVLRRRILYLHRRPVWAFMIGPAIHTLMHPPYLMGTCSSILTARDQAGEVCSLFSPPVG